MNNLNKQSNLLPSFVCRERVLNDQQRHIFNRLWSKYGIDLDSNTLELSEIFQNNAPTVLEIGFGMGTSLLASAADDPSINFVGVEVYRRGVFKLLSAAAEQQLSNIKVICADAVAVLQHNVADESLQGIHIYFPDPWPKRRHHKRRLIQAAFIDILLPKLIVGGHLHIKTDWADYAKHIQHVLGSQEQLLAADPNDGFKSSPTTKYEKRAGNLGHAVHEIYFIKK